MRIRQVALVARELEPVVDDLCAVLGIEVGFRDPGVAEFGLQNAVLPLGTTFLEVVSPVRADAAAARFLDRNGGDGGYMVLVQTPDLEADRRRLASLGVRVVWQVKLDDIAAVHLHPRDVGAAIVSLDEPRPPASWRWGGPDWQAKARTDVVRDIAGITIGTANPPALAARWCAVLGFTPPVAASSADVVVALDETEVRFARSERGDHVAAVRLAATDGARALAVARARSLRTEGRSAWIGGVRFDVV
jgi:hypothetical protein